MSNVSMPSAQHAPAMPQQSLSLPPNATRETMQQIFRKFTQLARTPGIREDDPELVKLRNWLQAAKQANDNRQHRLQLQAQQQQQASNHRPQLSQDASTQQTATNGTNFSSSAPENTTSSSPSAQGRPQSAEGNNAEPATSHISQDQLHLLRHQMAAFKLLSKDTPLPVDIQRAVFASQQPKIAQIPLQTLEAANEIVRPTSKIPLTTDENNASTIEPKRKGHETFTNPSTYLKKYLHFADPKADPARFIVPSLFPSGVDVNRVREDRENIIYNRMRSRKAELEQMNANVTVWDSSKSAAPIPDEKMKLKALIEYKKLCLLPKQRDLRRQIAREIVATDSLAMTANRAQYRRQKKQSMREARITERLEKQQRDARETKEKQKQGDYLRSIMSHADEVHKAAREQRSRINRLGRLMISHHQVIEKEEQRRVERTAKQRLQALKANDEETYLKLLGQAKDSRISHLLKQTDGFLGQLAASVKTQQRNLADRWGSAHAPPEVESDDDGDAADTEEGRKVDYFEVAHRIKEEVHAQANSLVGGSLKDYQLKGLQWMISLYNNNLNGILADEMGLGKTIQTISLITYLIEKKQQFGPFLVIVPLSTLTNWNNEFEKWAPSVRRIVYKGPPNSRKQAQNQIRSGQFEVLLTTYEFIIKDRPVLSKVRWVHMIVDEGHRMKNAGSKLSTTITHYYQTRFRIILTGTPLQNNLPELWALLNFVLPNIFKSVKSFDEWFNTPFANTGSQDSMSLSEEEQILVIRRLHKVLRPFLLRRLKKDVEKDLPDKQERVIKCNFSSLQAKLYKQLMTHNKLMVSDGKGGKTGMRGLSNMLMQLRKLCNHPFVFEEVENQMNPSGLTNDMLWRTSGKFELLDRILPKFRATGHRVLMFFQMTQIMNIMEDFMRLRGIKYLRLDGSTKSDERADLLKEFNAPGSDIFCFLLSTRAGGLGLNLQTADTVIIYDSDWNPHQDLQAQDRAHRIGQKNEVRILRLISSNSVEEKILERAQFKLDMDGKVIQAGRFDNKSTNEERDAMLRVMLESAEAAENLETEEMDDDDLNMMMIRSEDELEVFQRFDEERARHPLYGPGKQFPRLLGESELPDIYMQEDNGEPEEIEEVITGRGARERTRVRYDDGLTEEQWVEAVDNDDDTIEEAMARKQQRVANRQANKSRRDGDDNIIDSPPPERESSEEPMPKKRGRKPNKDKRKADEASLDSESMTAAPVRKRGRQAKAYETLSSEERKALQDVLDHVHDYLMDYEDPSGDENIPGRSIIDFFIALPDRKLYADYYQIIQVPMCMEQMSKKINRKDYQSLDAFAADIQQMCRNAKTYNEDGSQLYKDATTIEEITARKLEEESKAHPALGAAALGNSTNGFAASTTAQTTDGENTPAQTGSGTGTPGAMPKLKLNFGGSAANGGA